MAESEIKVGDKVRGNHSEGIATVIAADGDWLWLKNESLDHWTSHSDRLSKVEPFFEIGKTYKDIDGEFFECKYIEEREGKRAALGISYSRSDPSDFYPSGHLGMCSWTEVTNG